MRALIVDDSSTMRAILGRLLEQLGYEVRALPSGIEALATLRAGARYDLMLVD